MQKTQTTCLIILTTIAGGFSLFYLKSVLLPFIIALFIVIGCRPILTFIQQKLKLHWFFAFIVTFSIGVAMMIGFICLVWLSIYDLANHSDAYQERLQAIAVWIEDAIAPADPQIQEGSADVEPSEQAEDVDAQYLATDPSQPIDDVLKNVTSWIQREMLNLAGSLTSILSYFVLILIFVFFMLLEDRYRNDARLETGRLESGGPVRHIVGDIEEQIRKYLLVKTVISIFTGLVFGLVLWFFSVPLAILFGFLAFLLNYIPNFGPLISILLPTPFLVLNSDMSPTVAIICFALISTTQFVSGNVVEPRIMGKSFDVSPVFLLLALMFFGLVWGIIGMFLATPIISVIKIVLQGSRSGRVLAEIMAGRWDGQASVGQA